VPYDSYSALTTADVRFPSLTLSNGSTITLTYGQYRALLETNPNQDDRAAAYRAFHQTFADSQNTYAALYNGVLQCDWFHARARGYASTLDAALHGNNIPTSVVDNLSR
jgi:oligoendopeptidase F